jgi:hypothetical protein
VLDIYAELYRLLGVDSPDAAGRRRTPPDAAGRRKPPCCDEDEALPPVLGEVLSDVIDRAARFRKTRRSG